MIVIITHNYTPNKLMRTDLSLHTQMWLVILHPDALQHLCWLDICFLPPRWIHLLLLCVTKNFLKHKSIGALHGITTRFSVLRRKGVKG